MIDSHCHLDAAELDVDRSAVLARAALAGLEAIIVPAVDEISWQRITTLVSAPAPVTLYAALGLHPVAVPALPPEDDPALMERLDDALSRHRPVALGECGLDTTVDMRRAPIERQERLLIAQLAMARRHELPVILHARGPGSYARLDALLRLHPLPDRGGVIHSYGGGASMLPLFLRHGLMFGVAGPVTYAGARKVCAAVAAIPDDRLLAETDAPDQTPAPWKPGRCEPGYLPAVVAAIARVRGREATEMAALTAANARRLFALPA